MSSFSVSNSIENDRTDGKIVLAYCTRKLYCSRISNLKGKISNTIDAPGRTNEKETEIEIDMAREAPASKSV